jgi:hypothetical protein
MKKVKISLAVLSLALVTVGTVVANSNKAVETYTLVSSHPDAPLSGTFSEIQPHCPGSADLCATGNQGGEIRYDAPNIKF